MPVATEYFELSTRNFVLGLREIEEILEDPRLRQIVVRGGLLTVLPTVEGLNSLLERRRTAYPPPRLAVPSNALSCERPRPDDLLPANAFLTRLLDAAGVRVLQEWEHRPRAAVLLLDFPGAELAHRLPWPRVILCAPRGAPVPEPLRTLLPRAFSCLEWNGRNAFFSEQVEEAAEEMGCPEIQVLGGDAPSAFYTALGAVDHLLVRDSWTRKPDDLSPTDLYGFGRRVSVVAPCEEPDSRPRPALALCLEHLRRELGVQDTEPRPDAFPVPGHRIALDLT